LRILLVVFIICSLNVRGQFINNNSGSAFSDQGFFNPAYIQALRIQRLTATISIKKKNDGIRLTKDELIYHFDTIGNLIQLEQIKNSNDKLETTNQYFNYDSSARLIETKKDRRTNWFVTHFNYDSLGRIHERIESIISKETQEMPSIITYERIEYTILEEGVLKKYYDENKLEFKEQLIISSQIDLIEETEKWKMSIHPTRKKFLLNDGRLASLTIYTENKELPNEENCFTYNSDGELESKEILKDGVFINEWQLLYDPNSKIISALINQDKATGTMEIFRFKEQKYAPK
jgi:antitoxin component YwqK of YwqJK toxin-antitoxin module